MKKPVIGVLLGALVYFVWGMVSWTVFPWHSNTIKHLPEEQLITDTLKTVVTEPGYYAFPFAHSDDGSGEGSAWVEKYRKGPVGAIVFQPTGQEPMGPVNFIVSLIGDIFIAFISMMVLMVSRDRVTGVIGRASLVASLGVLVGAAVHLPYWNWMHFPAGFTLVSIFDSVFSFLLMGVLQALFVPKV